MTAERDINDIVSIESCYYISSLDSDASDLTVIIDKNPYDKRICRNYVKRDAVLWRL